MKIVKMRACVSKIAPGKIGLLAGLILLVGSCSLLNDNNRLVIYSCHEQSEFIEPEDQCLYNSKLNYFRGIWYGQTKLESGGYKYAGGLATYTSHHSTSAVYNQDSDKTFFTYGGTRLDYNFAKSGQLGPDQLYIMVALYDHQTAALSKPTLVFDKWTNDPHDNPALDIDPEGYILLFAPSHGDLTTPSYILKSTKPASIDSFEVIEKSLFAYPQSQMNENGDGIFFYTSYQNGRTLKFRKFLSGQLREEEYILSSIQAGHYQVTSGSGAKIGTAFNYIPRPEGSDYRTNLYYLETLDYGDSWQDISGNKVTVPVKDVDNTALIKDYRSEGMLVYIMDMAFDEDLNPVILYNLATDAFPESNSTDGRLMIAFYRDQEWNIRLITDTDHNYNMGSLNITGQDWTVIVPTGPGPQENAAGGELEYWSSGNKGSSWDLERRLTNNSFYNHNYVRKVRNAKSEFSYIWANGDAKMPSESRLFYSDKSGLNINVME